jgi:hypothetical protein
MIGDILGDCDVTIYEYDLGWLIEDS